MHLVESESFDAAKIRAVEVIKQERLRAIRFWDGNRVNEVNRPAQPAPAAGTDNVDERAMRMLAMKADGKTRRQIAAAFGISAERVHQVIARANSRAEMHAMQPNCAALSVRAINVLRLLIDEPETDPSERDRLLPARVAALTRNDVFNANNAGKRTLAEAEAWLWERGLRLSKEA